MNKLPTACRQTFCAEYAIERGYCKAHAKTNPYVRKPASETDKLYQDATWKKCSRHHREMNPQCQLIVKGVQCLKPAELAHHIVSPRKDITLFLDWRNLVSLCWGHHDDREGDDPRNPSTTRQRRESSARFTFTRNCCARWKFASAKAALPRLVEAAKVLARDDIEINSAGAHKLSNPKLEPSKAT